MSLVYLLISKLEVRLLIRCKMTLKLNIILTSEQKSELLIRLHRRDLSYRVRMRLEIIRLADLGKEPTEICSILGQSKQTVCKFIRRFSEQEFNGLYDQPRSGRPAKLQEEHLEALLHAFVQERTNDITRVKSLKDMVDWLDLTYGIRVGSGHLSKRLEVHCTSWKPGKNPYQKAGKNQILQTSIVSFQ